MFRRITSVATAVLVAGAMLAPSSAVAAPKRKAPSKRTHHVALKHKVSKPKAKPKAKKATKRAKRVTRTHKPLHKAKKATKRAKRVTRSHKPTHKAKAKRAKSAPRGHRVSKRLKKRG
jgi:hypothetical protein